MSCFGHPCLQHAYQAVPHAEAVSCMAGTRACLRHALRVRDKRNVDEVMCKVRHIGWNVNKMSVTSNGKDYGASPIASLYAKTETVTL